jgi:hypothetical protein
LCLEAYSKGVAGVKAACQATTSQTLIEYGKYLGEPHLDQLLNMSSALGVNLDHKNETLETI